MRKHCEGNRFCGCLAIEVSQIKCVSALFAGDGQGHDPVWATGLYQNLTQLFSSFECYRRPRPQSTDRPVTSCIQPPGFYRDLCPLTTIDSLRPVPANNSCGLKQFRLSTPPCLMPVPLVFLLLANCYSSFFRTFVVLVVTVILGVLSVRVLALGRSVRSWVCITPYFWSTLFCLVFAFAVLLDVPGVLTLSLLRDGYLLFALSCSTIFQAPEFRGFASSLVPFVILRLAPALRAVLLFWSASLCVSGLRRPPSWA